MKYRILVKSLLCLNIIVVGRCFAGEGDTAIRIPALVHSWKSAASSDDADITVDEISKCMGVDLNVRTKFLELQREGVALNEEFDKFPKFDEQFATETNALGLENQRFNSLVASGKAKQEELAMRKTRLERSRPPANAAPDVAKKFNASVSEFNVILSDSRRQIDDLNISLAGFRSRVEAFNAKIESHNQKVAPLNERGEAFRLASIEFRKNYGNYLNKCAGERNIKR